MIPGDVLLDAFIDANILFVLAYALWLAVQAVLRRTGLRHAWGTQLGLLNGVFLAIVLAPLLVLGLDALRESGALGNARLTLSDMAVSYYLNGGIEMQAAEFERLLLLRNSATLAILDGSGWLARAVIAAFGAGLVVGLVRLGYSILCLRRIVADSYAWRGLGRVRIRLSDRTLVPFSTRGLRNYYIVLPSHLLTSRDALTVSLAHEFQHLRQGDIEWEIALEALKPLFFLNPAYHAWKRRVEDLRELNCDSAVLSRGRIAVRTYCDTLLSVCQKSLRRDRAFVIAVPKVTLVTADRAPGMLENRILSLFAIRRPRHPKLVAATLCAPLMAAILLAAVAIQSSGDWSQDRLMLSTVVNLERLDEINRLSTFGRLRN